MLQMFYQSVAESTISLAVVSWGEGIKAKDANRRNKLIKKAESVVDSVLVTLEEVVVDRMLGTLLAIVDNVSHPVNKTLDELESSFSNMSHIILSSISHSCQRSNNTVFHMRCPKPIRGPEFQLSKSRSTELY